MDLPRQPQDHDTTHGNATLAETPGSEAQPDRPLGQRLKRALAALGGGVRAGWRELDPEDRVHHIGRQRTRQLRQACSRGAARIKTDGERLGSALRDPKLKHRVREVTQGAALRARGAVHGTTRRLRDSKWVGRTSHRCRRWFGHEPAPSVDQDARIDIHPSGLPERVIGLDPSPASGPEVGREFTPPGVEGPTAPMPAWSADVRRSPSGSGVVNDSDSKGFEELDPHPLNCPSCGERALGGLRKRMLAPGIRVTCPSCGESLSVGTVPGVLAGVAVGGLVFLMGVAETALGFFAAPILILALDRWWVHGVQVVRANDPSCRPFDRWTRRRTAAGDRRPASA